MKNSLPASADEASQTRVGRERSHRRAVSDTLGSMTGEERRNAVPVCLVPGRAGDGILGGGLEGWS